MPAVLKIKLDFSFFFTNCSRHQVGLPLCTVVVLILQAKQHGFNIYIHTFPSHLPLLNLIIDLINIRRKSSSWIFKNFIVNVDNISNQAICIDSFSRHRYHIFTVKFMCYLLISHWGPWIHIRSGPKYNPLKHIL